MLRARAFDHGITDTRRRIAAALAAVEPNDPVGWEARFLRTLEDFVLEREAD